MKVEKRYRYIRYSIENAGLRHLKGSFLFQIERNGEFKTPASPDDKIQGIPMNIFIGTAATTIIYLLYY
jgi:hypothetical protein